MVEASPESPNDRRILRLAFLAPALQRDIIAGLQPANLNLERFMKMEVRSPGRSSAPRSDGDARLTLYTDKVACYGLFSSLLQPIKILCYDE